MFKNANYENIYNELVFYINDLKLYIKMYYSKFYTIII